MISANESLSSTMKNEASKRSLKRRGMMKKEEEVELNECFKREGIERRAMLDNRR